ncbi:MAG: class I SAM-dependent methyltransferase [Ruminococcus sp.]|nr:class I SAM-dependent methyltransferase [Ruminococcus sp.]
MDIFSREIDGGKTFDWGRTSSDYAKYRDIYPPEFFGRVADLGLCIGGQRVLDIGTGTGVVPRNMYRYGAKWTGADISKEQIAQARILAERAGMDIEFVVSPAEELSFPEGSFDVITACQCFFYFDYEKVIPKLASLLRTGGKLVILFMAWVPGEDPVARASEELVLKYNPSWSGAGYERSPVFVPEIAERYFRTALSEGYDLTVPFTRESWNGRMKACRGVGASMSGEEIALWEAEHLKMLAETPSNELRILHHAAMAVLEKK